MDFASFDTALRADDGAWLHLRHPTTEEPLYVQVDGTVGTAETERPCRVLARGNQSEAVRAVVRAHERREGALGMKLLQETDEARRAMLMGRQQEDRERHHEALVRAAVVRWEGIIYGGEEVACTPENVAKVFASPRFKAQLFRHCGDEERFFGGASNG